MKYNLKGNATIKFLKTNFRNTILFLFKKKAMIVCVLLLGITSIAQTTSADFFVSEGTPVAGLENIHVTVLVTQKPITLEGISITSEQLVIEKKEIGKVQLIEKHPKKPIATHFNKPKTTTVATQTYSIVLKTHKEKQNSNIFSTENSTFCSTNTTPDLNKKLKIVDSSVNFKLVFIPKNALYIDFILNFGVQEVNYRHYISRPPPVYFS